MKNEKDRGSFFLGLVFGFALGVGKHISQRVAPESTFKHQFEGLWQSVRQNQSIENFEAVSTTELKSIVRQTTSNLVNNFKNTLSCIKDQSATTTPIDQNKAVKSAARKRKTPKKKFKNVQT